MTNKPQNENLKELFKRFLGTDQAQQAGDDIRQAEEILQQYPSPEPDDKLIADIKMRVQTALLRKKTPVFRRASYRVAAVAAVFIVSAVISVKLFEPKGRPIQKVEVTTAEFAWDSNDDTAMAILTDQVEQLEEEILASGLDEDSQNVNEDVEEIEIELMEIDTVFWKG